MPTWWLPTIRPTRPAAPAADSPLQGIKSFEGRGFYADRWNHGIDLTGKNVVSIGTSGNAIAYVPKIAQQGKQTASRQPTPAKMSALAAVHPIRPNLLRPALPEPCDQKKTAASQRFFSEQPLQQLAETVNRHWYPCQQ